MDQTIINLKQWIEKGCAPPEEVQIYPTNRCNLKCIFCCQTLGEYDFNDELSEERWLEIAKELCEMGVKKILISGGGEPLMIPATLEMMKIFKSNGLQGRMINNGVLWDEKKIRKTIEMGWDTIMFSIDGPKAKIHDKLRGIKGCFDKIIKNIEKFNEIKQSENKDNPRIEINFVLNKLNYESIMDMINLANKLKINFLNFEPICMNNSEVSKLKLTEKERIHLMEQIIPRAEILSKKLKVNTNINRLSEVKFVEKAGELDEEVFKELKSTKNTKKHKFVDAVCFEPWLWPKIEANGELWPCSTVPLKITVKDKSFKELWYGKEMNEFREKILKGKLSESCKNCVMTHLSINKEIRKKLTENL